MEQAIRRWLEEAAERGASDIHLVAGHKPTLRLHGGLIELGGQALVDEQLRVGLQQIGGSKAWDELLASQNVDFALTTQCEGTSQRFRANYFVHGQSVGACFRIVPAVIPDFAWSGFPYELAERLAHLRNGLVLITGVTGAGKTTSLAMILNLLNKEGGYRIITIEDPIEYQFPHCDESIMTQRELGQDVASFADGLKFGLRQDPDIILVGEIRDQATAQIALSAAETGHLVFSTLHTRDAKGAISRFTDLFHPQAQPEARAQISRSLRAVVSQHLLPSTDLGKRTLALEVMFNNNPIASAIRLGKLESIDTGIVTGRSDGMMSLDESLKRLVQDGSITRETALKYVSDATILGR